MFEKRHKGGVISKVELSQARSQYEVAAAAVPVLQQQIAQQENALSVLLGRNPGPIARDRVLLELGTPQVPAGLPSAILTQRPDVVSAEQSLIAANARVSAARALYFPSISLTGLLGVASLDLDELFDDGSGTWNYAGTVTGPIFQGGSILGVNRQAEAQRAQLLASYEKTVQRAFADVDDALIATQKTTERNAAQQRQVEALRDYARLARKRFEGGYSSLPRGARRRDLAVQRRTALQPGTARTPARPRGPLQGARRRLGGRRGCAGPATRDDPLECSRAGATAPGGPTCTSNTASRSGN